MIGNWAIFSGRVSDINLKFLEFLARSLLVQSLVVVDRCLHGEGFAL